MGAFTRSLTKRLQAVGLQQFEIKFEAAPISKANPYNGKRCTVRAFADGRQVVAVRKAFAHLEWERETP